MGYNSLEKSREYGRQWYHKNKRQNSPNGTKIVDDNIEEIIILYKSGKSTGEIADKFNISRSIVRRRLMKNGIKLRPTNSTYKSRGKHHSWNGYEGITGTVWAAIKQAAKCRNLELSITKEYIWNLFLKQESKCAISGVEIKLPEDTTQKRYGNYTASLDRKDSSKGYIEDNVQWVHKDVNIMKQDMSDEEFINWCHIIARSKPLT